MRDDERAPSSARSDGGPPPPGAPVAEEKQKEEAGGEEAAQNERSSSSSSFGLLHLPRDAVYDIFSRADPRSAVALAGTCRRMRAMTNAPGAEQMWREVARRRGWHCVKPERYLTVDGDPPDDDDGNGDGDGPTGTGRPSLLSGLLSSRSPRRKRTTRGAWRMLCGRGNHKSYTEAEILVRLPFSVSELATGPAAAPFTARLELGGRTFELRAFAAEPEVTDEPHGGAGVVEGVHPFYGVALTLELELTGDGDGDEPPEEEERSSTSGAKGGRHGARGQACGDGGGDGEDKRRRRRRRPKPLSAHVLFQLLREPPSAARDARRPDRTRGDAFNEWGLQVAAKERGGGGRTGRVDAPLFPSVAPLMDPLTAAGRVVAFHRFEAEDFGVGQGVGNSVLSLSRCVPCSVLHSRQGRFVHSAASFRPPSAAASKSAEATERGDGDGAARGGNEPNDDDGSVAAPNRTSRAAGDERGGGYFVLRIAALLHEDADAAAAVPGWRRAGRPRSSADVAGARSVLLEAALVSPEVTRRAVAAEMFLLWYLSDDDERRHPTAASGVQWRGVAVTTARGGAGGRSPPPERAAHNVARVFPSMLSLLFDGWGTKSAGVSGMAAARATESADRERVAQTAALILAHFAGSEAHAAAMVRGGALGTLRRALAARRQWGALRVRARAEGSKATDAGGTMNAHLGDERTRDPLVVAITDVMARLVGDADAGGDFMRSALRAPR